MPTPGTLQARLGAKLRELRQERGLSVRTLAAKTDFSPSFISQIESDIASPSIASLERIAATLGVTLSQLFSAIEATSRTIVRRDERDTYESAWSRSTVALLTDSAPGRRLAAVELTVAPGGASASRPMPNPREACAVVLAGTVVLTMEEGAIELRTGDTAYLDEGAPFAWKNGGEEPARLIIVGTADQREGFGYLLAEEGLREVGEP